MKGRQLSLPLTRIEEAGDKPVRTPPARRREAATTEAPRARPRVKLLEEAIRGELGHNARLVITDTRSTLLSQSRRGGVRTLRVHQMFLEGDRALFEDIARYLKSGCKSAGVRIDAFIDQREHLLAHHVEELPEDAHKGRFFDLRAIFDLVNRSYFQRRIRADITWGQRGSLRRKKRSSITLGSYDDRARRITVHPVLDQPFVPALCVARIVHHEMLHAQHPPRVGPGGRRVVHGPEFRRAEALFDGAEEADAWFEAHLDALLRYRPPRPPAAPGKGGNQRAGRAPPGRGSSKR